MKVVVMVYHDRKLTTDVRIPGVVLFGQYTLMLVFETGMVYVSSGT